MHKIVEARTESDYRVWLKFADGASGTVDLSFLVGKSVFKACEDKAFFESVFIDEQTHTLAWAGGIDLCPDNLYSTVTGTDVLDHKGQALVIEEILAMNHMRQKLGPVPRFLFLDMTIEEHHP